MKQQKILITGAAGFIGSHLVDLLLEKGYQPEQLRLLIPRGESLKNLPAKNFDIIRGDIRDKKIVKAAMKQISSVFHLAARIDFEGKTYREYEDVNVDATRYLLERYVLENQGKYSGKFIFYSSIGVYGLPAGVGEILNWDEDHPPTYSNFYGRSKWEGEELVREFARKFKMPYGIIRPASVYGPREKGPTLALIQALVKKQFLMIGSGKNKMHYVYVKDLVAATYLLFKNHRQRGEYIIAGNQPIAFEELIQLITDKLSIQLWPIRLNKTVALSLAYILELLGKILNVQPPLYPSRVRTMTTTYSYNITRAKTQLGYQPRVGMSQGLDATIAFYKQHGLL